ncbi:methyltransferase [Alteromonas macleodii]|uniref:Methyltransferase domain protein n=1 Tax=Alteromonas macleodii TaxID=28108 RepID=A0AB36FN89_ALTMA|nr:methyltransferase [Alteromonas macleodii]OES24242.1 methyltransferase domain protein [Alteromonas macleodii]OES24873.1 methyltransferase domain protein [Alteromonas macleodii]OES25151.1 methyltransferase domain protein [Alteromonas macleodii]OES39192.1 methyltransferase domain protein [Alteromonas macleodii]
MARLTKAQNKAQQAVIELLKQDILNHDEKVFVLENYHEAATNMTSAAGAFFTPLALAHEFAEYCSFPRTKGPVKILDLCAGIGVLSFALQTLIDNSPYNESCEITCVEINPDYIAVGQKLLPNATWVQLDVSDIQAIKSLGQFDLVVSNPPFGNVPTFSKREPLAYTGSNAIYAVAELAALMAGCATLIMPQQDAGFKYSGETYFQALESEALTKFTEQTGITFIPNNFSGTDLYERKWKAKVPRVEFAECDFSESVVQTCWQQSKVSQGQLFG